MLPEPQELARLIAKIKSMDFIDKQLLILKTKYLSSEQIKKLYEALLKVEAAEEKFESVVNKIDLRYELKFQEAYADSTEMKPDNY